MIKFRKPNPITTVLKAVLLSNELEHTIIQEITAYDFTLSVVLRLPPKKEIADLLLLLPNLQQELNASDVKFGTQHGKLIQILFGMRELSDIKFDESMIKPNSLQITLPSSYGEIILDFEDGASCHMLNGGAPRMGKTIFLLYLSTMLYTQSTGNIQLFITSPKAKDFYPLFNLPGVTISKDEYELEDALNEMIREYKARNTLLYSDEFKKATDAKTVREFYPNKYHLFKPIFLIIDEYARFSENREIQKKVAELVQTAGYVNVHVVITTQRPDARSTLPANIKMGLMTRICFRTADENNSIVILDEAGAEKLPNIKGRALLLDGEINTVQIPNISYNQCEKLVSPYRKEEIKNEPNQSETGPNDSQLANQIQNMFQESNSLHPFSK